MKLDGMDPKALRALRDRIDIAIAAKMSQQKEDLREKFKQMAAEHDTTLDELFGRKKSKRGNGKPMRDPSTGVVWAGRGRRPHRFDAAKAVPV